jgi:hypothetical protein
MIQKQFVLLFSSMELIVSLDKLSSSMFKKDSLAVDFIATRPPKQALPV